ncbi:MAG TPA: hypothetical protein VK045_04160 [Ornithinicoccus sp.]|nr:hypothetical protein [Ornithinicoccus sp.]
MKLLSSLLALALVGALSVWLWVGQTPSETVAEGVSVTFDSAPLAPEQEPPAQATGYAAALLGLRTALDMSFASPAVLDDPDRLSDAIQEAKSAVDDEAEAREEAEEERRRAEEEHAKEEEKRAKDAEKSAQPVSPPPVSPPSYNCEWDDDEWDCDDDDDDDDDWDDWDDR